MGMLEVALNPATVVVAVDPGKVMNRVWVSNGAGLLEEPVSLPVARSGIAELERLLAVHAGCRRHGGAGDRDRGDGELASGLGG
jgi:hypothetical protein